ncbi:MAG TPA: 2OG-Fe(II) oxygenase [Allosphingosinicella sp.]|nr:2OG-Fe(II) oxygenase [Allosphingosinicella sp.]
MGELDYKIRVGGSVKERLERDPRALKLPTNAIDVFVVRQFLTPEECVELIRLIDENRVPSTLLAPTDDPDYRTSESCNLAPWDPMVRQVENKLVHLLDIDYELGETIQGQRYAVGQQFKPHHDFFYKNTVYWDEMQRTGGQRTWTAMAFLNTPEGGGQTNFPRAGIKVSPVAGNLLVWNNLDALGEPNPETMHQGMPVTQGVKYIITKWHRERPWIASAMHNY